MLREWDRYVASLLAMTNWVRVNRKILLRYPHDDMQIRGLSGVP